jgi:hypothetical protein
MPRLLDIGAGSKDVKVPPWYDGWEIVRLDIKPEAEPDLLMDACDLETIDGDQFDAAYASHLLEHIYPFDLPRFFSGLRHVLTANGFVEFHVPNALRACQEIAKRETLSAFCYDSPGGMITAWDMLYGYEPYQMAHGTPFVHHNAFDADRLSSTLNHYGFPIAYVLDCKWGFAGYHQRGITH